MSQDTVAFVMAMANRFAALRPMLSEHRKDNFGEVLPHIFFGDMTRYLVSRWVSSGECELPNDVCAILRFLEEAYLLCGPDIRDLIGASFLENLPSSSEPGWRLREFLGPQLKASHIAW